MNEGSTSTVIVKKVRRREPDNVAGPYLAALVLLLLLLTLLLPSDGAKWLPDDDTVASNPYWRPGEIAAAAQLAPAEDFSYQGLVLNEDEQLVLHFEQSRPADEPVVLTTAAVPAVGMRYYGHPYAVPVYIYLPMWHHGHHLSYYRLAHSSAEEEDDTKDASKLPEGSVVIPEPSAALLLLLSMLPPALRRRK